MYFLVPWGLFKTICAFDSVCVCVHVCLLAIKMDGFEKLVLLRHPGVCETSRPCDGWMSGARSSRAAAAHCHTTPLWRTGTSQACRFSSCAPELSVTSRMSCHSALGRIPLQLEGSSLLQDHSTSQLERHYDCSWLVPKSDLSIHLFIYLSELFWIENIGCLSAFWYCASFFRLLCLFC